MTRPFGDFITFVRRILLLYVIWMLCRVGFYCYNLDLTGPIAWSEFPSLLRGAVIFDSASIFYLNGPFLLLSLLPFRFRERRGYQRMLLWLFVAVNSAGLVVNLADIFYYPFKLGRIASDDAHFLTNGNFGTLALGFLKEYWYAVLAWIALGALLWFGFRKIGYRKTVINNHITYYISQTALLGLAGFFAVFMIRGGNLSGATYPVNLSDAGLYASPAKAGLVLSNPFCVIRTAGDSFSYPVYFEEDELDTIFSPLHTPADSSRMRLDGRPNVMLIILESFATPHIKALSDQFAPSAPSFTPFLDSLIGAGYVFRNAYHNGSRSLDALPSLWASIPTFKRQFLSMPQSVAPYHALPACLDEMGYTSAFLHGAVRESMSFQAFGRTVGVEHFWSREDYEAERGGDFDGKWGIWDHRFFPFAAEKVNTLPQPFFATMFSLSSHHPFILPAGFDDGRYPESELPIQRMIAYSDDALRRMFAQMAEYEWFKNTIFILTADHGSGADSEKYRKVPYNFAVPLLFYSPVGLIPAGSDERPAGHIDLMPTLLGILGYDRPYFAFGRDLFAEPQAGRTINYLGAFNTITDSLLYLFNEREFTGVFDYRADPLQTRNLAGETPAENADTRWTKAFIQQYYKHLKNRDYRAD